MILLKRYCEIIGTLLCISSWFIRHTTARKPLRTLSVYESAAVQQELFDQHTCAVHLEDLCSLNFRAYGEKHRTEVQRLRTLAEESGSVCAEYPQLGKMLIGRVKAGSKIFCSEERHFLKRLMLTDVREVSPSMRLRLLAGAPRKIGLSQWHVIGERLERLLKGEVEESWEWLLPYEQETVCQEYLRRHFDLLFLLLPFGAALEGVDLYGITAAGERIYAVLSHQVRKEKLVKELAPLVAFDGVRAFFCPRSEAADMLQREHKEVEFVWSDTTVWEWLGAARNRAYKDQLFAGV